MMKSTRSSRSRKGREVVGEGEMHAYSVWQDGRQATVYAESIEKALRMPGVTGAA